MYTIYNTTKDVIIVFGNLMEHLRAVILMTSSKDVNL